MSGPWKSYCAHIFYMVYQIINWHLFYMVSFLDYNVIMGARIGLGVTLERPVSLESNHIFLQTCEICRIIFSTLYVKGHDQQN